MLMKSNGTETWKLMWILILKKIVYNKRIFLLIQDKKKKKNDQVW